MKHIIYLILSASVFNLSAAVPLRWTVETSSVQPATFDQFAGATYDLEATLQSLGKPLAVDGDPQLFWQTNGMGSAWWTAPATVSGNVLRATWTPACDVGARVYNCFIGITGTVYNAAFQLRLRPSPGATPNALPLPTPVIDFSRVTVLNPPWPSGSARPLPRYLHYLEFDDTYPDEAAWYYEQPQDYGSCSAVRDGGFLSRNYDWRFDDSAEFVVRVSAGPGRFASIGVANCGTNLTETFVTSGKPSRYYKCLPGRTVDGINCNGVVAEVNVVDGDPEDSWDNTDGDIHPLAAVRWTLDHATIAGIAASNLAVRIKFPSGWKQNFHWMIADERETWIVENGEAHLVDGRAVMTNFQLYPTSSDGAGFERYNQLLEPGLNVTNVWYSRAYSPPSSWLSDFGGSEAIMATAQLLWTQKTKELHRSETFGNQSWWQTVHTSIYDITNRVLSIAVQETDDWYTFKVPSDGYTKGETDAKFASIVGDSTNAAIQAVSRSFRRLDDEHVYVPGDMGQFTYDGEPGIVDAIGGQQPIEYDSGDGYAEYDLWFSYDGFDVNAYGYGRQTDEEISFSGWGYKWNPETGDEEYIDVNFRGLREAGGWVKTSDTFARESSLGQIRTDLTRVENELGGETKVMRLGGEFEYGSGWGYVQRLLDNDRRMWRIRVPRWSSVSGLETNSMSTATSYSTRTNSTSRLCVPLSPYPGVLMPGVLSWYDGWGLSRKLVRTHGIYGNDGTQYADYRVGLFFRDAVNARAPAVEYDVVQTTNSPMSFKVAPVTNGLQRILSMADIPTNIPGRPVIHELKWYAIRYLDLPAFEREWTQVYSSRYSFDIALRVNVTGVMIREDVFYETSNGTIPIVAWLLYDAEWTVIRTDSQTGAETVFDGSDKDIVSQITVTVTCGSSTSMEDLVVPYYRVLSTRDPNLYYDSAQDATYRIAVTNGCFYSEKVMNGDWRTEE